MKSHAIPLILGLVTLGTVVALLIWDFFPGLFPFKAAHDVLGALPLALIACACVANEITRRRTAAELFKAALLALAFLFWAANQFWPNGAKATLYNDLAIALFVLDVFLVILEWPQSQVTDL